MCAGKSACLCLHVCGCVFLSCALPVICPTLTRQTSQLAHLSFINPLAESRASSLHVRHLGLWLRSAPPAIFLSLFFVGYYYQHCHHCSPCSSPLTLLLCTRPTDLLNKSAQTNTFIHDRVERYVLSLCHARITWHCNSSQTHCCVDKPRVLFVALQQKISLSWLN